jgi:hypothetical protein
MGRTPQDPERRRFPRHPMRIPCRFRIGDRQGQGFVTDLSAHGLFLQTTTPLEDGAEIRLDLDPRRGPPLQLLGKVVRVRASHREALAVQRPGAGVRITSAPEAWFQLVLEPSPQG